MLTVLCVSPYTQTIYIEYNKSSSSRLKFTDDHQCSITYLLGAVLCCGLAGSVEQVRERIASPEGKIFTYTQFN